MGLWPQDKTNAGFVVTGLQSITQDHVILPKLFRRLVTYLEGGGSLINFRPSIATEQVLIISTAHATHFDTVVDVNGNTVKMTEIPENLMFKG
jgi:hypothetical protein